MYYVEEGEPFCLRFLLRGRGGEGRGVYWHDSPLSSALLGPHSSSVQTLQNYQTMSSLVTARISFLPKTEEWVRTFKKMSFVCPILYVVAM